MGLAGKPPPHTHSVAESVSTGHLRAPEQGAVVAGALAPGSVEVVRHEADEVQVSAAEKMGAGGASYKFSASGPPAPWDVGRQPGS